MSVLSPTLAYSILWSILPRRMNGGKHMVLGLTMGEPVHQSLQLAGLEEN